MRYAAAAEGAAAAAVAFSMPFEIARC